MNTDDIESTRVEARRRSSAQRLLRLSACFAAAAAGATIASAQTGPVREYIYAGDRLVVQHTNFDDVAQGIPTTATSIRCCATG